MRFKHRKGQSAIEYLTTYGWALLAIVIVGAVLVNMGVFSQCQKVTPRFSGQGVAVDSWAFTGTNTIEMTVRALNQDVTMQEIELVVDGNEYNTTMSTTISAGNTQTFTIDTSTNAAGDGPAFSSGACASADLTLIYDMGQITGVEASGSGKLTGPVP
ncbi:MAG: hypothetical protein ABEJ62_01210 [Candidatus Nanohaloarchaea archaeon]